MNWHNQSRVSIKQLFKELYFAQTEDDVDKIISNHPDIFGPRKLVSAWKK